MRLLRDHGLNTNARCLGIYTPPVLAVSTSRKLSTSAVIYVLREKGAPVVVPIMQGCTPLYHEAIQSHEAAQILLILEHVLSDTYRRSA